MNLKKYWRYILTVLITFIVIIVLPTLLVSFESGEKRDGKVEKEREIVEIETEKESGIIVSVFRSKINKVEEIPLDEYVIGVVASEMPADSIYK